MEFELAILGANTTLVSALYIGTWMEGKSFMFYDHTLGKHFRDQWLLGIMVANHLGGRCDCFGC